MKRTVSPLLLAALLLCSAAIQAAPIKFVTELFGTNEVPSNASPGTGTGVVLFDTTAHTLRVVVEFAGLIGNTTNSHIHCCQPAGTNGPVATAVPTFPGFPSGVTSGSYDQTFDTLDLATYNPVFVTTAGGTAALAETLLFNSMVAGLTYLNVHSNLFPGGEIRGQLQLPEPGSLLLAGLALMMAAAVRMRRR